MTLLQKLREFRFINDEKTVKLYNLNRYASSKLKYPHKLSATDLVGIKKLVLNDIKEHYRLKQEHISREKHSNDYIYVIMFILYILVFVYFYYVKNLVSYEI